MNSEWSLKELYNGYEDEAFKRDFERAEAIIAEYDAFAASLGERGVKENVLGAVKLQEEISDLYNKLIVFSSLHTSVNTSDEKSASIEGVLSGKLSNMAKADAIIKKYLATTDGVAELAKTVPELSEYAYYFQCIKDDAKHMLSDEGEQVLSMTDISGFDAWEDLWEYVTSKVTAEYEGKPMELTALRNLAYSPDADVRKKAYEAELICCEGAKDAAAFALNSMKLHELSVCKLRHFSDPLEKTLHNARVSRATLDALMSAMDDYMPMFRDYLRTKGKALGHDNGLPWYDMFAPMGGITTKYTVEEAREYLLKLFNGFAPPLAAIVKRAFDEEWIDFYPHSGKIGGAFCADIPPIKQFRVLTNFEGYFTDIVTLAHELGHGYHSFMVHNNRPLNQEYSMPVAETASTFNENVIMNAAIAAETDPNEKLALIDGQLSDITQVIVDIYSRFLFEKSVIDNRADCFMFPDKLCELMLDAQRKSYGDGLDPDVLHKYMWVVKCQYYRTDTDYYNFPYAFGALFARGLYEKYLTEGEAFLPKYNELLRNTPSMSAEDCAKICGIDLTDKAFWVKSLKSFEKNIELFKELALGKN